MTTELLPDTLDRPDVMLDAHTSMPHCEVIRRLHHLSETERLVIVLRHGLAGPPRSTVRVAVMLGISPEQVRVVEAIAAAKLRHPSLGRPAEPESRRSSAFPDAA